MGLVDRTKTVLRGLEDRVVPQRFVFHHVPKCGGTSVGRGLRKRYLISQATVTPENSFRAFELFTGRTDREQMLVDVLDLREQMMMYLMLQDVRGVSLHVRFSQKAYERFSDSYKFITILREPVARFVSHYFWSYGKPHAHAHITEDFGDFLETERARRLGASYVEYLCGLPKEVAPMDPVAIEAAIANLAKFDVIGFLDDIPGFEAALKRELRVRIKVGRENVAKSGKKPNTVLEDPAIRAKVEALCAPDLAVWNAAQAYR